MSVNDIVMAAAGVDTGGGTDDNFENVTLLLNGNGTNGAQNKTVLDSSSNNFTITDTDIYTTNTQGSFSPYGSLWSNYFNGSSDYLTSATSSAYAFGTGDFTIEGWFFLSGTTNKALFDNRANASSASGIGVWVVGSTKKLRVILNNAGLFETTTTVPLNQWNHIAIVRNSGTITAYLNGVAMVGGSATGSTNLTDTYMWIGELQDSGFYYNGYISNFRVVKGTAVYTSAFTPSTTPLTAVSGTSLLTCQSNRFIDNSSNAFAVTVTGTPSVQRFSPFNPTASYSTATFGGSGFFDGGSGLTKANAGTPLNLTGNFTIEFWLYRQAGAPYQQFINYGNNDQTFKLSTRWYLYAGAAYYFTADLSQTPLNAWTHIAFVRSGSTITMYANGISVGSITYSSTFTYGTNINIGCAGGADEPITGFMTDLRIVKDTAVYTSNFTPPTAPLTAISGTQLLLNFKNAGIPDYAMMNDLRTVGNAQVSTSVKKFGTGSIKFDGTGDYLKGNNSLSLGSGNFTVECWVYVSAFVDGDCLLTIGSNNTYTNMMIRMNSNWTISIGNGSSWVVSETQFATKQIGQWAHIAIVRNNGTLTAYYNGTSGYSTSNTTDLTQTGVTVGNYASLYLNGYVDDLRITKGYARYTANFTPPTAALPTK